MCTCRCVSMCVRGCWREHICDPRETPHEVSTRLVSWEKEVSVTCGKAQEAVMLGDCSCLLMSGFRPSLAASVVFWSTAAPSHVCVLSHPCVLLSHINKPVRPNGWPVWGGFSSAFYSFFSSTLNTFFIKSNCAVRVAAFQGPNRLCTFLVVCLCFCVFL